MMLEGRAFFSVCVMWRNISDWFVRRQAAKARVRDDARFLIGKSPATAYYDAQRLAARARFAGDGKGFIHWARVAAEVARIGTGPMDIAVVRAIVDEEERLATRGKAPATRS
jgi:hypothetical protein